MVIGSGGFKTTTAISTLLYWTGSAVILDPAGEIAPMLRAARERMGHKVYEIDPSTNVGFNVLDWIDITSPLADTNIDSVVVLGMWRPERLIQAKAPDFLIAWASTSYRCFLAHILADPDTPSKTERISSPCGV